MTLMPCHPLLSCAFGKKVKGAASTDSPADDREQGFWSFNSTSALQPRSVSSGSSCHGLKGPHWEAAPDRLELTKRADGQPVQLGCGSRATVYMGTYDGVRVAVKVVQYEGTDPAGFEVFARELLATLHDISHPNLLLLRGGFVEEGHLFLVQELMAGDLWSALADPSQRDGLRWHDRGRQIALDVARGLERLHLLGILHLNLISSNILLTTGGKAKIGSTLYAPAFQHKQDDLLEVRGLPYMPPEMLEGHAVSRQTDVWFLGVVLFELCRQQRPTRGQMMELRYPEECPEAIARLVQECMSDSPEARPSAREVALILQTA